jgi:tetraacyldisaccharide 4'-kinase
MQAKWDRKLNQWWYGRRNVLSYLLWPLSCLYRFALYARRSMFRLGLITVYRPSVPVLVVGNITLGGVGKTPVVAAFAQHFMRQGRKVGIVSRGYGGQATCWPQVVKADSDPALVGDEPVMLAQQLGCYVAVAPKRVDAIRLCEQAGCDLVISDDGLSHFYFARDFECIVIDGQRGLGNGFCLPAGPLRESASRLARASMLLTNTTNQSDGSHFYMQPTDFIALDTGATVALTAFKHKAVHAVAAIGNNQRFFETLRSLGCEIIEHSFPDHYSLSDKDLAFNDSLPIIITEKDAVKCADVAIKAAVFYLRVQAVIHPTAYEQLNKLINP